RLLADKGLEVVSVSALHGDNVAGLVAAIRRRIAEGNAEPGPDDLAPNARQAQALRAAKEELDALAAEARQGLPHDLLGVRLEAACSSLAGVTGEIASHDVLNAIFERFCIGK
ncbi:MAG: tRNA uridine-5-carboxymethylaminomethyl(34) synthesis GTPase MnmE, partial [Desulfovibrionaceae bacterium]